MSEEQTNQDISLLTPGERLRRTRMGCKLVINRWGLSKSLSKDQRKTAANAFGAQSKRMTGGKKLANSDNQYIAAVSKILSRLRQEWQERTDEWIEDGVRLLKTSALPLWTDFVNSIRAELTTAVEDLQAHLSDVKAEARQELGDLYNDADYPVSIVEKYGFTVDYPSLEPPEWLQGVNPDLYREQAERVRQRFDEAASLGEQGFVETFHELVSHLSERLEPGEEGERKVFKQASLENVNAVVQRFKNLYCGSNAELEGLVNQAQEILTVNTSTGRIPISVNEVKNVDWIKSQVKDGMNKLKESLDKMVTTLPRRQFSSDVAGKLNEVE